MVPDPTPRQGQLTRASRALLASDPGSDERPTGRTRGSRVVTVISRIISIHLQEGGVAPPSLEGSDGHFTVNSVGSLLTVQTIFR